MATMESMGPMRWRLTEDPEGYREYKISFRVRSTDPDWNGGPYDALRATGLPEPGDTWNFLGDVDPYSYCRLGTTVTPQVDEQKNVWYEVEKTFSNKGDTGFCRDARIDNPLLQPQKVSISSVKFQEEATHDMFGDRILTSSHEQIRGPQNEWDNSRPQVRIEQNVSQLQISMLAQMIDTVNMFQLWGLPPRTVKFSDFNVAFNYYGTCFVYYTRQLVFDIRFRRVYQVSGTFSGTGSQFPDYTGAYETFDRHLLDEGTKVLRGKWATNGTWELTPIGKASAPDSPTLEWGSDFGSITPGTYTYAVTSVTDSGETPVGVSSDVTLPVPGYIRITWTAAQDATHYGVYRKVGSDFKLVAYTDPGVLTYDDLVDGSLSQDSPTTNTATIYPDASNPAHFVRFQDRNMNTARVILDGEGRPALSRVTYGTGSGTPDQTGVGNIFVQKYGESNLLLLGIPTVLG